jgi:phosphohistidine phosphatase
VALAVYLVRHAFAAHADPARWPDDAERPVTPDGADRFRRAARGLRRIAPDVDAVLSSAFARAWQTAELLRDEAGWPDPERCPALEVGRPIAETIDALRGRPEETLALVGHEPHLSSLASLLCAGRDDVLHLQLKKGGVVLLTCDGPVAPGAAYLRWAVAPKILRALDLEAGAS